MVNSEWPDGETLLPCRRTIYRTRSHGTRHSLVRAVAHPHSLPPAPPQCGVITRGLKVDEPGCEGCGALDQFWDMAGAALPPGEWWWWWLVVVCGGGGAGGGW